MININILHKDTRDIIYSRTCKGNNLKNTVEFAVRDGVDLSYADLSDKDLSGVNLSGVDLTHADLSSSYLHGADLSFSNLIATDFCGSIMNGAQFQYSDLSFSDMGDCALKGCCFSYSKLRSVRLSWSLLDGANFNEAYLIGAFYGDATLNKGLIQVGGLRWRIYIFDKHIKIGCKLYETSSWETFTDDEIAKFDPGALQFWCANKTLILGMAKHHQG